MLGDRERHARADADELTLERVVSKRHQRAATIADEVMVMSSAVSQRLEAHDALPDLDPRDELGTLELLEDAIDTGARDASIPVLERGLQLDRGEGAVLV